MIQRTIQMLRAASNNNKKPTLRIKRLNTDYNINSHKNIKLYDTFPGAGYIKAEIEGVITC
jgi:hypothetical protein